MIMNITMTSILSGITRTKNIPVTKSQIYNNLSKISEAVKHAYRKGYAFDDAMSDLMELGYEENEASDYLQDAT